MRNLITSLSTWSDRSMLSFACRLSVASTGSIQSIASVGSILSVGSAGSILSFGSAGSILSVNSAGSILSVRSRGKILCVDDRTITPLGSKQRNLIGLGGAAAMLAVAAPTVLRVMRR